LVPFAELEGLYLVAREIGTAVRQAQRVAAKRFEQALPIKVKQGRRPMPKAQGHALEHRVGHLEAVTKELEDLVYQRTGDLNDRIAQLAMDVADRELDLHTREKAIREFLREMLTADLRKRRLGVGLLAVGIVLATAGNLVSLAA
jgi:hypothetical protein